MEKSTIYTKLFSLKEKIGKISKDSKNPFFKSKYFDVNSLLENVEPLCHDNRLLLLQPILNNKVCTKIIDVDSGEEISSEIDLPNITDPQKLGSAITYFRRYTLQSLLGVQAEDDDANKASATTPKISTPTDISNALKQIQKIETLEALTKLYNSDIKFKTNKSIVEAIKSKSVEIKAVKS